MHRELGCWGRLRCRPQCLRKPTAPTPRELRRWGSQEVLGT